jgi:hypothetical protein
MRLFVELLMLLFQLISIGASWLCMVMGAIAYHTNRLEGMGTIVFGVLILVSNIVLISRKDY